jgi:hypothetical protein
MYAFIRYSWKRYRFRAVRFKFTLIGRGDGTNKVFVEMNLKRQLRFCCNKVTVNEDEKANIFRPQEEAKKP